jgi:NADH-quinone oxidoreductase subunit N
MTGYLALVPLLVLAAGALAILLLEAFLKRTDKSFLGYAALGVLLGAGFFAARCWGRGLASFGGRLALDRYAVAFWVLFAAAGAVIVLLSMKFTVRRGIGQGEYYGLLLFALAGLMIMVSTPDLIVVFLGLEVLSVSSYALAGLDGKDPRSSEAAVKYFLMGSFASAFLVFGLALLYGAAGTLEIGKVLADASAAGVAAWAGLALVLAGFAFKVALVPFHMWAPDVYEGSPTPVTAFFAVGPKAAVFAVLVRLLAPLWGRAGVPGAVFGTLWAVAALTMVVGNLAALRQKNLKRLLAYSSIAHSGYILVAVLAGDGASLLFYLVAYLFMTAGAFAALIAMTRQGEEALDIDDFAGAGIRHPWLGGAFAVLLFSLAGFPPTAGFLAKFYVFSAAVRQGHIGLVVIAALASLVSVFYYLRIVVVMYMKDGQAGAEADEDNPALYLALFLCLYGVIQIGIWPGNLLAFIRQATASLF